MSHTRTHTPAAARLSVAHNLMMIDVSPSILQSETQYQWASSRFMKHYNYISVPVQTDCNLTIQNHLAITVYLRGNIPLRQQASLACCTITEPCGTIQLTRWSAPNVSATLLQLERSIRNKMDTNRDNSIILSIIITLFTEN